MGQAQLILVSNENSRWPRGSDLPGRARALQPCGLQARAGAWGGPPGRSLKDPQPPFEKMGHELAGSSSRGSLGWWDNLINGTAVARVVGGRGSRWQIAKPVRSSGRKKPTLGQCNQNGRRSGDGGGPPRASPARRRPTPITSRLSVSPRNGLCSRYLSPARLRSQQVAHVSLGERLSHLRVQREGSQGPQDQSDLTPKGL